MRLQRKRGDVHGDRTYPVLDHPVEHDRGERWRLVLIVLFTLALAGGIMLAVGVAIGSSGD
jgi:hypothetical protein